MKHFEAKEKRILKTLANNIGALEVLSQISDDIDKKISKKQNKLQKARVDLCNNAFFLYRDKLRLLFREIQQKIFIVGRKRYILLQDLRNFVEKQDPKIQRLLNDFGPAREILPSYCSDQRVRIRLSKYEKTFLSKLIANQKNIKKTLDLMIHEVYSKDHENNTTTGEITCLQKNSPKNKKK